MSGILSLCAAGYGGSSGLAQYDGFASTRGYLPTNLSAITAANVRSGHWARSNIPQLKIPVFNYYGATEAAPGATMGVKAYVEYPAGTMTPILFSGSATGTVPDGGTLISDYLTIAIPNGERYWIRLHQTCSAGLVYTATTYLDRNFRYMGDAYEDSATDHSGSGDIPDTQPTSSYYTAVIAPTTAPTILIADDSIGAGVTDLLDVGGDMGIVARTIGPDFGYFNAGMPGEAASNFVANHTQKMLLAPFCSHVFVGHGTNDLFAGDSKATIEGNLTTVYGLFSTKTVFGRTIVPRTDSDNSWATSADGHQTYADAGKESVRAALNVDLRSTFGPPGGVFDTGAVVELSAKWIANKTNDGIHPNASGYADIAASAAINKALIGTPATPAAETGSAWGDHGTKITLSTRRRTNDTAAPNTAGNPSTTVRGAGSNNSGQKYFELELIGTHSSFILGLMNLTTGNGAALDDYVGNIDDSFGITNGAAYNFVSGTIFSPTSVGSLSGITEAGDVYGWAVDFTNKFAYLHRNHVYFVGFGGVTGVPTSGATGTGHTVSWTGTPTLCAGATLYGFDSSAPPKPLLRIRTVQTLYAPPSGYSAWG